MNGDDPPESTNQDEGVDSQSRAQGIFVPVSLERITDAPVEVPGAVDYVAQREKTALAHKESQFRKELGWLGLPFGGRKEKPGNISALVITMCFLIIIGAFAVDSYISVAYVKEKIAPPIPFDKLFAGITSIVTLALGYLFGSNEKAGRDD